jgi:hypothetical protein
MAWGDAFKSAWNKATDAARNVAGALATGAKKVIGRVKKKAAQISKSAKKKAIEATDWAKKKSDQVIQWTRKKASEVGEWIKDKSIQTAKTVKRAYRTVKKIFNNAIVATTKATCNLIQKGLDGAEKENQEKDAPSKFFDVVKPSAEKEWKKDYPQQKGWGSKKKPDDTFKAEIKVGVSATSKKYNDRVLYYGDEDNNLQIGSYGYEIKHGIAYNPEKREFTADVIDLSVHAEGASWQSKNKFGESDLATIDIKVDALAMEGKGKLGATWGSEKKEVVAEIGVSADLIKAKITGTINITPKSIWDNTFGHLPFCGKAPKWLDHGISAEAEGEAGIGVGGNGEIGIKDSKFVFRASAGLGPKLGFKLGIGFK